MAIACGCSGTVVQGGHGATGAQPPLPRATAPLLAPCALRGTGAVGEEVACFELRWAASREELVSEVSRLLGDADAFAQECDMVFSGSAMADPEEQATGCPARDAGLLPVEDLHAVTQRLIYRLGCRAEATLERIAEVFVAVAGNGDYGVGALEFRGFAASVLTQALRELEVSPAEDNKAVTIASAATEVVPPQSLQRGGGRESGIEGAGLVTAFGGAMAGFSVLKAGLTGNNKFVSLATPPAKGQAASDADESVISAAPTPDQLPCTVLHCGSQVPAVRAHNVTDDANVVAAQTIARFAPCSDEALALHGSGVAADCLADAPAISAATTVPMQVETAASCRSWRDQAMKTKDAFLHGLDVFADRVDAVFAPAAGDELPAACELPLGGGPMVDADGDSAAGGCGAATARVQRAVARLRACKAEEEEQAATLRRLRDDYSRQEAGGGGTEEGDPLVGEGDSEGFADGEEDDLKESLEEEAGRLLRREGLPTYVGTGGRGWTARLAVLSGDNRHLYVVEAEPGLADPAALLVESACFSLLDLRQVTRRSVPGWHVLSLHFEDGVLMLRFSYLEYLDVLVRTLSADRRLPVLEGTFEENR